MERPLCQTCGIRIRGIYWYKDRTKSYFARECHHCSRVRRGKPINSGDQCTDKQKIAKELGFNVTVCNQCGWFGFCHVHHKDSDPNNNNRDNIEILCPNCHMDEQHGKPKSVLTPQKQLW